MPKKRLTMRQIREVLRLKYGDSRLSDRAIALQLGVARSTIQDYLGRVEKAGLTWPLPDDLSDTDIDQRLFGRPSTQTGLRRRVEPDWAFLARELKRNGVTLQILWEEYRASNPEGYGYSRYVAARLMWRKPGNGLFPWLRPQHNFDRRCGYRAFRNAIRDGSVCCRGLLSNSEMSTRASAFAFISMSTSA